MQPGLKTLEEFQEADKLLVPLRQALVANDVDAFRRLLLPRGVDHVEQATVFALRLGMPDPQEREEVRFWFEPGPVRESMAELCLFHDRLEMFQLALAACPEGLDPNSWFAILCCRWTEGRLEAIDLATTALVEDTDRSVDFLAVALGYGESVRVDEMAGVAPTYEAKLREARMQVQIARTERQETVAVAPARLRRARVL